MLNAAFAVADITPGLPCAKLGWLRVVEARRVADPLFAKVAAFESGGARAAFAVLDALSVRYAQVAEIRKRVEAATGLPGRCLMISATHSHAGPAVASSGDVRRDEAYLQTLVERVSAAVIEALGRLEPATIGFGRAIERRVAHNRRVVQRDGTVKTHGDPLAAEALFVEGPIDQELAVVGVRTPAGKPLGCLVNYALHPTFHGDDDAVSANWPGALARWMQVEGWPVTLFQQGAMGNIAHTVPPGGKGREMEAVGEAVAESALGALERAAWTGEAPIRAASRTLTLPYRRVTPEEIEGRARGAQRFIDSAIYDREIPRLVEKIKGRAGALAEVQVIRLGDHAFAGIPAELFVELGLRIKERTHPLAAHVVGAANGMIGYVPTREAFARGGYETTFAPWSKLAPEAGDLLADTAVELALSV